MDDPNQSIVKRLDALLGLALTRKCGDVEPSLAASVRYLRTLGFSNGEIAAILGKTIHHIEVEVSKLARKRELKKLRGSR